MAEQVNDEIEEIDMIIKKLNKELVNFKLKICYNKLWLKKPLYKMLT